MLVLGWVFITGIGNICDVIPFPHTPQNAEFYFENLNNAIKNRVYTNQVCLRELIKTLKTANAGFACVAAYFIKQLIKIKIF